MNTPRLRRGGGIASSSNLVFYVWCYSYIVYFVCDSASELERWALLPFWGFPALTCFFFSEFVIFRNFLHIFSQDIGRLLWGQNFVVRTLIW